MQLPQLKDADRYTGLYIVDFGDKSSVGFTADEVAGLLESEKFKDIKVYKIYNAYPDGRMELKGVSNETFGLEAGMFFYEFDRVVAEADFKSLVNSAVSAAVPGRAKVHLAKYSDEKFVTAIIYPAEYNEEFSKWLLDIDYKTAGPTEGGIGAVKRYYDDSPEILDRQRLLAKGQIESKTGKELLAATTRAVVR
ncbi:MAG: hypothetical protein JW806_03630 [Sedimentisphaerales bacterium]|nr:hypothetical protein [Sedimentisphaerales bacterium]